MRRGKHPLEHAEDLLGLNPLGPSRKVKAAIRKASKSAGMPRPEDAQRLVRHLSLLSGVAKEGIRLVCSPDLVYERLLSLYAPAKIACLGPALPRLSALFCDAGAEVVRIAADSFLSVSAAASSESIEASAGADMIFLSTPNRVTGARFLPELLASVIEKCAAPVIVDCSLDGFPSRDRLLPELAASGRVTLLGSSALYYGLAGAGVYALYSHPETAARLNLDAYGPGVLEIAAARSSLRDKAFADMSSAFRLKEMALLGRAASAVKGIRVYCSDSYLYVIAAEDTAGFAALIGKTGISFLRGDAVGLADSLFVFSLAEHSMNSRMGKLLKGMRAGL